MTYLENEFAAYRNEFDTRFEDYTKKGLRPGDAQTIVFLEMREAREHMLMALSEPTEAPEVIDTESEAHSL